MASISTTSTKTFDPERAIVDRLIAAIAAGTAPWRRPWTVRGGTSFPLRANGERYRGINELMLWLAASEKGYASPYWMAYRQAQALGALARQPGSGVRRLPGGLLHGHDVGEELASLPGGRICFYEAGPQAQAPLNLDDEVALFIGYYRLTARQTEILRLVMRGHPSSCIVTALGLSEGTVRNHRKEIDAKIDVTTEPEIFAAFFAFLATR